MKETLGRIQFFKMISKLSMSNRNLLASRLSFIIFGFCSKQINSMLRRISGLFFNKLDSQEDAKSLFFTYSSISIIAALLTSVVYGIRFYYSSLVCKYVAPLLFSEYIRTDYNEFHIFGPSKNLQRMNRNSWSLRDAMEIAAYEITLNFVSIMVATRDLFQILEIEVFLPMIIVILVIFLFQMVFYVIVNRLKAEIIQIDELKITEMADVFNNIKLFKTSHQNEENLMKNYFKNTLYLRYRFLCLSSEFITALALIIPNIYALYGSKSLKVNVSRYVKSIASLNSSMLLLKSCFFKLEARRLELQDLIQSKSNVRIQNTEFKSSIEFLNLSVNFKSCRFHDLNFKFNKNDKIALIGENGTGKSTFLKILLGFIEFKGEICIDNNTIFKNYLNISKNIGYCSQSPQVFDATVMENLISDSKDEKYVYEVLAEYEMLDYFKNLKNGFNTIATEDIGRDAIQIINLMRAIIRNAPILILDEPFSFLNQDLAKRLVKKILDRTNGKLLFLVLHNSDLLADFDKILSFDTSSILLYDSYEDYALSNK